MFPNIARAVVLAAIFGAAVLILGGILAKLGSKAGGAVRSVV